MRRWLLYCFLAVVLLLSISVIVGKIYLSAHLAPEIVVRLQSALGVPVRIESADVGISGGSALQNVQVFEPPPAPNAAKPTEKPKPWFRVDRIDADVSALGLLNGATQPAKVELHGVSVDLRFDSDGNLLTRLPAAHPGGKPVLPELVIDGGRFTIEQEGRQPFVVEGIQGKLLPDPAGLKITGTISDPKHGQWNIGGQVEVATGKISLALDTPAIAVTAEKLKEVPFVPAAVWQQVTAEGTTSVRLDLQIATDGNSIRYKLQLAPTNTRVAIAAIDLRADQASGSVVIADRVVTLAGVSGHMADGSVSANGTLDFRDSPAVLSLDVGVRNVAVQSLPRSWEVSDVLDGRLTGSARLRLRLTDPVVQTEGSSGEGTVSGVSVLGLGEGSARLFLHPGPGRFSFRRQPPTKKPATSSLQPASDTGASSVRGFGAILGQAVDGLGALATGVVDSGAAAVRHMRRLGEPADANIEPTYFDANVSLQDVDLGELVRRLHLKLPFELRGNLSFQLNVGFPADRPHDLRAYRFQGDARFTRLQVAGIAMEKVRARVRYANGLLVLETLRGDLPSSTPSVGSFDGDARYQILPAGDLEASLRVDNAPIRSLGNWLPTDIEPQGRVSGNLQVKAAGGRLSDPNSCEAKGTLRAAALRWHGLMLKSFAVDVSAARGELLLNDVHAELFDAAVRGTGKLRLAGTFPLELKLVTSGFDLANMQRLDPAFRPPVTVRGKLDFDTTLKGTLQPMALLASGSAHTGEIAIAGARLTDLVLAYAVGREHVAISQLQAKAYDGRVSGMASLPLRDTGAGDLALRFDGVNAGAFSKEVAALPVRLEGSVSGKVGIKIPAAEVDKLRAITTEIELAAPDLRVQGIPTQRLRCTILQRGDSGSYRAECDLAGGTFKLEGKLAPRADPQKTPAGAHSGSLQLRGARVSRILESLFGNDISPLHGSLSVDLPFGADSIDTFPSGRGTVTLRDVRWGDTFITDRLQGELRMSADGLSVSNVLATIDQGELRANAAYLFARGGQTVLNVELSRIDAARFLAVFPKLEGLAQGSADISLRLSGGRELRGSGRAVLTSGRVLGVAVADWRVPLEISYLPGVGGQLDIRDSTAQIAGGRAVGRASLNWADTLRLEGTVRFFDADLRTLLGRDSGATGYTGGFLNGTLDFNSDRFRSADDVNASLAATLRQAQTAGVPVVEQFVPFIGLFGGSSSTRFDSGELRGRLTRGVFRLQRFTLSNSFLQIMLEGSVTLAGRIDLNAMAGSGGRSADQRQIQILGLRIPAIGPLPLAVLVDTSAFLANRIIRLRVTGTWANPVVRVEPSALLSEDAIRFFFNRSGSSGSP